jgi:hypothetical protein
MKKTGYLIQVLPTKFMVRLNHRRNVVSHKIGIYP